MILVDSSVWIQIFGKSPKLSIPEHRLPEIATCPPVIQEVLQGVTTDLFFRQVREGMLALPCLGSPVEMTTCLRAADLYRSGRKRGVTVRSAIDCLIAAIALENRVPVWHVDRDFDEIARFTELEVIREL